MFFFFISNRLQLLTPFDKWDGKDLEDMTILIKVIINIIEIVSIYVSVISSHLDPREIVSRL